MSRVLFTLLLLIPYNLQFNFRSNQKTYEVLSQTDVSYGSASIRKYDVFYPNMADLSAQPILLFIHGGGWTSQSKSSASSVPQFQPLARLGWIIYSIDFTNAVVGDASTVFPKQEVEIREFCGYLAEGLGVGGNVNKITGWGYSSGSHLILLQALASKATWLGSEHTSSLYTFVGVIVGSSPTDLGQLWTDSVGARTPIETELGYAPASDPVNAAIASPSHYVGATSLSIYMASGTADTLIPDTQTSALVSAFAGYGVTVKSVSFPGYQHATGAWFTIIDEPYQQIQAFAEGHGR